MICYPLPPKKDHWIKKALRRVASWAGRTLSDPLRVLKVVTGYVVLLIFLCFMGWFAQSQYKHAFDTDYKAAQRLKYGFSCSQQISKGDLEKVISSDDASAVPIRLRYFALMEAARKSTEPHNAVEKIMQFSLCANFTKLGFAGVELAQTKTLGYVDSQLSPDTARKRKDDLAHLARLYPDFPESLFVEARCLLENIRKKHKTMSDIEICDEDGNLREENKKVVLQWQFEAVAKQTQSFPYSEHKEGTNVYDQVDFEVVSEVFEPDGYVLAVGADKRDIAALSQVSVTKRIIGNSNIGVFERDGWLRTVVFYPNLSDARTALTDFANGLPYGAYIRSISDWCPGSALHVTRTINDVEFVDCRK